MKKNLYSVCTSGGNTVVVGQEKTMISYDGTSFTDIILPATASAASEITQVY